MHATRVHMNGLRRNTSQATARPSAKAQAIIKKVGFSDSIISEPRELLGGAVEALVGATQLSNAEISDSGVGANWLSGRSVPMRSARRETLGQVG